MSRPSANVMYHAAQALVRSGQPVFPCHSDGERAKRPITRHGVKDATLNLAQIKQWWQAHRTASIGIPTGIKWDVLDVDTKGETDGRRHLTYLHTLGYLNGCKRVVRTPSGGFHLYFVATPGITNKANAVLGLDVRALGGYVLAPPSVIDKPEGGGPYFDEGETTDATDEPLFWDQIQQVLAPFNNHTKKPLTTPARSVGLGGLRFFVMSCEPGERNNGLHWAASRCVDDGLDPNELIEAAIAVGLEEDEIMKTIGSVLHRAGVTPRELSSEAESMFAE